MSRAFSSAARQLKKLGWGLNGTTVDVAWAQRYTEDAVDIAPGLADRVDNATVQYVHTFRRTPYSSNRLQRKSSSDT